MCYIFYTLLLLFIVIMLRVFCNAAWWKNLAIFAMTSFDYNNQNPSFVRVLMLIRAIVLWSPLGLQNFNLKRETKWILEVIIKSGNWPIKIRMSSAQSVVFFMTFCHKRTLEERYQNVREIFFKKIHDSCKDCDFGSWLTLWQHGKWLDASRSRPNTGTKLCMGEKVKPVNSSSDIKTIVKLCLKEASKSGIKVVGIHRKSKCMKTKGDSKYDRHGGSNECEIKGSVGVGLELANFVYVLKE